MVDKKDITVLGVGQEDSKVILYYADKKRKALYTSVSDDAYSFNSQKNIITITDGDTHLLPSRVWLSYIGTENILTALVNDQLYVTRSTDKRLFTTISKLPSTVKKGVILSSYVFQNKKVLFFSNKNIGIAYSSNLKTWDVANEMILHPRPNYFDSQDLIIGGVFLLDRYIMVVYFSPDYTNHAISYTVGIALLYKENPQIVLWRSSEPLWKTPEEWNNDTLEPLGVIYHNDILTLFCDRGEEGVAAVSCIPPLESIDPHKASYSLILEKYEKNPIIRPIPHNYWESKATFNSAVVADNGKVHFLYRAIGDKDVSVIGYAASTNGIDIDERLSEPAYVPREHFESPSQTPMEFSAFYMSGGGYGGCEDPRITKIDSRFYMTYVAYDGYNPPRVAITSISEEDFLNRDWNWTIPRLISQPHVVDKNACILPEKINGKYVIFHRIFPDILIDFVDDLEFNEYLKGEFKISPRPGMWDSLKIGAGPPPIKTRYGWLLIYQSVGYQDRGRYKIGAMLLDENDPTKVIARSNNPIIQPDEAYENEGLKAGVAYPCGAAVIDNILYVYYGGADTVICVATRNLDDFITELKEKHTTRLDPRDKPVTITIHYAVCKASKRKSNSYSKS